VTDPLLKLDAGIFLAINAYAGSSLDYLCGWTTHLATPILYGIVFLLILVWDDEKPAVLKKSITVIAAGLAASGLNALVRGWIGRDRPYAFFRERIIRGEVSVHTMFNTYLSNSFPSGHAVLLFAVAGALHAVYGRRAWFAWPLAGAAAMTRVYVGAHFPSDVLAGAVLGGAVGFLAAGALRRWAWRLM
jgi:undecaprenyl-diphosphatase